MKSLLCLLLVALFLAYPLPVLCEAGESLPMLWQEQTTQEMGTVIIDAAVTLPLYDTLPVWEISPDILTKETVHSIAKALLESEDIPEKPYGPSKDFSSSDAAIISFDVQYVKEEEGGAAVLSAWYLRRLSITGSAFAHYSCSAKDNRADFASALKKADGTLHGMNKSMDAVILETSKIVKRFAPEFELFIAGSLGREAFTRQEKENPDLIPQMVGLVFTRKMEGIPVLYRYAPENNVNYQGLELSGESIMLMAGDNGIAEMVYEGAMRIDSTLPEEAALLDFAKVKEIAKKQLSDILFSMMTGEQKVDLIVNAIVLGYQTVASEDGSDRILLTPVWNFYGGTRIYDANDKVLAGNDLADCGVALCLLTLDAQTGHVLPQ